MTEREATAFRTLKTAWEGPGCESDWLEFCQDFDWDIPAESAPAPAVSPWEALLQWSRDQDPEHAGNGPFISLQHDGDEFDKPASVGVVDGSASGEGKTANEAARDLCAKLGIEMAPAPTEGEYPDPSPSDLERPEFEAVWQAIKGWDIQRSAGQGYAGATGNDVMHILDALAERTPTEGVRGVRVERRHREEADGLVYRLAHPLDSTGAEAARQANRTLLTQALAAAEARGAASTIGRAGESEALRAAILDIDAHATPQGLLDESDPTGSPAYYCISTGCLHRALGIVGHSAPKSTEPYRGELGREAFEAYESSAQLGAKWAFQDANERRHWAAVERALRQRARPLPAPPNPPPADPPQPEES